MKPRPPASRAAASPWGSASPSSSPTRSSSPPWRRRRGGPGRGGGDVDLFVNPSLTWDDLERLRSWTSLPIVIKGILHPDDAAEAGGARRRRDRRLESRRTPGGRRDRGRSTRSVRSRTRWAEEFAILLDSGVRIGRRCLPGARSRRQRRAAGPAVGVGTGARGRGGRRRGPSPLGGRAGPDDGASATRGLRSWAPKRFTHLAEHFAWQREETYRLRAPASGHEAIAPVSPDGVYVDSVTGAEMQPVARTLPLAESPSRLPARAGEPQALLTLRADDRRRRRRLPVLRQAPGTTRPAGLKRPSSRRSTPCRRGDRDLQPYSRVESIFF